MIKTANLQLIHNYLTKVIDEVPEDAILLVLLTQLSRIAMLNRVKIKSYDDQTLVNIYGINFMPSGSGKDKTVSLIGQHILTPFFESKERKDESYKEKCEREMIEATKDMTPIEKREWIKENTARSLLDIFQDGTAEGFIDQREEYEKAGFGGTFVIISEFSDYILNTNPTKETFLSFLKEVYEDGNSYAKIIKSEKIIKGVKGVPNSILFQSTPDGLLDGIGAQKMLSFLNKGIARRSLLCYPATHEIKKSISYDEHLQQKKKLNIESMESIKVIKDMCSISQYQNNIYSLNYESNEWYYNLIQSAKKIDYNSGNEGYVAELKARPRKILKLAGLIALIEHPKDYTVTLEDVKCAESIVNHYSKYLKKFIDEISGDEVIKLFNYFLKQKKAVKKMDIRNEKFVHSNIFKKWFDDAITELEEYAILRGYKLHSQDIGSRGKSYFLTKIYEN